MTSGISDTTSGRRSSANQGHRQPQRLAIVAAAKAVIDREGGEAGTAQIAAEAGVNRPHVYRHFASKTELQQEVAKSAASDLIDQVRPMMKRAGRPTEIIGGVIRTAAEWANAHPNLYRFMAAQQQTKATHRARLGRTRFLSEVLDASAAYLQAARVDAAPLDGLMAGLMGMVDASIIWWLDHHDEPFEAMTDRVTRQVWLILRQSAHELGIAVDDDTELALPEADAVLDQPAHLG